MKQHLHLHPAKVIRWVDADTVILQVDLDYHIGTAPIRHRLVWINAYEKNTALGKKAIKYVNQLAPEGSDVIVRSYKATGDEDNFGRWLVEVYVDDESVNQLLLKEGFAVSFMDDRQ